MSSSPPLLPQDTIERVNKRDPTLVNFELDSSETLEFLGFTTEKAKELFNSRQLKQ